MTEQECFKKYKHLIDQWGLITLSWASVPEPRYVNGMCLGRHGASHREDGPAWFTFSQDGTIMSEIYYTHGSRNRADGPAEIVYSACGRIIYTAYWRNGQLHRTDGPARLGMSVSGQITKMAYHLNGVRVSQKTVMQPTELTVDDIDSEGNIEAKRVMIEIFGWVRYLKEKDAKVIDRRDDDVSGTSELLMTTGTKDDPFYIFIGACPSTGRVYPMRVPRRFRTCKQAQVWLKGDRLTEARIIGAS